MTGKELRKIRESLGMSRVAFSLELGIGSDRLASYESERVTIKPKIQELIIGALILKQNRIATTIAWLKAESVAQKEESK